MRRCPRCQHCFTGSAWQCTACGWAAEVIEGFPALAPDLASQGVGFEAAWFSELERLEHDSFWFSSRTALILWALGRSFPTAASMLEVGCGTGWVLAAIAQHFPHWRLIGAEAFSAGLGIAARRAPTAELLQMDARSIPYVNEFDVVGAFDVIEHIAEDELVLEQLRGAVRKGGGLILTVPQHRWLWSATDVAAHHERRYSAAELHRKVSAAGFEVSLSTSFVSLLLPAMLLSRLRNRSPCNPESAPVTTELRLPRALNAVLGGVMAIERRAIAAGARLPVGGSLLVVARAV